MSPAPTARSRASSAPLATSGDAAARVNANPARVSGFGTRNSRRSTMEARIAVVAAIGTSHRVGVAHHNATSASEMNPANVQLLRPTIVWS